MSFVSGRIIKTVNSSSPQQYVKDTAAGIFVVIWYLFSTVRRMMKSFIRHGVLNDLILYMNKAVPIAPE